MAKIEFALIAALYDNKNADFYKDIYFPIIKYSIVEMYYENLGEEKYYEVISLQNNIYGNFGVKIPMIVLSQALRILDAGKDGMKLKYYKDGQVFKVSEAEDISVNQRIDNRAETIRKSFEQLEITFQHYLEVEKLDCAKSFFDFFCAYSNETYQYIETGFSQININEEYVNLASFVRWIKKNQTDLYEVVGDVFWGAIIAGFLRRSNVTLGLKAAQNISYYLDSSLVLAILDLDSEENVVYAQELLDLIKNAGSIPKIHSITLREVGRILESLIKDGGPRPGSAIEEAYYRRNLSPSLILSIKNRLEIELEKKYSIVIDRISEKEIKEVELKWKNKDNVKRLAEKWNSTNVERLREIHDVYLIEYVKRQNRVNNSIDKYENFFVTKNIDLISIAKEENNQSLIHPGQIVLNLWIHNATSSITKQSGLVEVISRCFAMNQTDVRRKLRAISRYLKEDDFTPIDMKDMYNDLIRRSKETINEFEQLDNPELDEDNRKKKVMGLIEASKKHAEELQHSRMEDETKQKRLASEINVLREQIAVLQSDNVLMKEKAKNLSKQIEANQVEGQEKEEIIKDLKRIISNKDKHEKLKEEIHNKEDLVKKMEVKRQKSVSYIKFWFIISFDVIFLILLIFSIGNLIYIVCGGQGERNVTYIGIAISLLALLPRIKSLYILTPIVKRMEHKKEQLQSWEERHPEYNDEKEKLENLKSELRNMGSI